MHSAGRYSGLDPFNEPLQAECRTRQRTILLPRGSLKARRAGYDRHGHACVCIANLGRERAPWQA